MTDEVKHTELVVGGVYERIAGDGMVQRGICLWATKQGARHDGVIASSVGSDPVQEGRPSLDTWKLVSVPAPVVVPEPVKKGKA